MQRAEKLVAPNAPVNRMRWKRLEQNRLLSVLLDAIPSRQNGNGLASSPSSLLPERVL